MQDRTQQKHRTDFTMKKQTNKNSDVNSYVNVIWYPQDILHENKQLMHVCLLRSYQRNVLIIILLKNMHYHNSFYWPFQGGASVVVHIYLL